jgi:hypothetical protein
MHVVHLVEVSQLGLERENYEDSLSFLRTRLGLQGDQDGGLGICLLFEMQELKQNRKTKGNGGGGLNEIPNPQ